MGPPPVSPVEPLGTSRFQAELPDPQTILFCLHRTFFFFFLRLLTFKNQEIHRIQTLSSEVLRSELGGEGAGFPQRQSCVPLPCSVPLPPSVPTQPPSALHPSRSSSEPCRCLDLGPLEGLGIKQARGGFNR